MDYSDKGFLLSYEIDALRVPDSVVGCFEDELPNMWSWTVGSKWLEERALEEASSGELSSYLLLEEATETSARDFYLEEGPVNEYCLSIPIENLH